MFNRKGVIVVDKGDMSEDDIMMIALDAGADDILTEDDCYVVYTAPNELGSVADAMREQVDILSQDIDMLCDNPVDPDTHINSVTKLIDMLEMNDDVQNVYHNAILPEEPDED